MRVTIETIYKPWLCADMESFSRPVLGTVSIEREGLAVATDTYTMCVVPVQIELAEGEDPWANGDVLIPAAFLKQLYTQRPRKGDPAITLTVDSQRRMVTGPTKTGEVMCYLHEGLFPAWERITNQVMATDHEQPQGQHYRVNPQLLLNLAQAVGDRGEAGLATIRWCSTKFDAAAVVLGVNKAYGMIMPGNVSDGQKWDLQWKEIAAAHAALMEGRGAEVKPRKKQKVA